MGIILNFAHRQPFVMGCIIVGILALGALTWVKTSLGGYELALEEITAEGTEILSVVATRSVLESELEVVRSAIRRTEDNLVVEDNLADNLWYFYSMEGRTKTRLTELRQLNSPVVATEALYRIIPYDLNATGGFLNLTELLRQLETGPRLMRINEFSLRREIGGSETLSLELTIDLLGRK